MFPGIRLNNISTCLLDKLATGQCEAHIVLDRSLVPLAVCRMLCDMHPQAKATELQAQQKVLTGAPDETIAVTFRAWSDSKRRTPISCNMIFIRISVY